MAVRRFLLATKEGIYMEPNEIDRGFVRYTDEDLQWVEDSDENRS